MNRKPIPPSPAAILRSVQKDEQYTGRMKQDVHQLLQIILGPRNWIHWKQSIDLVTDLSYYGLTTLSGLQTLGEEYVRIVQIEGNNLKIPSFQRRLFMVLLSTSGPLMIDSLIKQLGNMLADVNSLTFIPQLGNNGDLRSQLIEFLPELRTVITLIQKFHLVAFYFLGTHHEISKRVAGVNYTAIRTWLTGSGSEVVYKFLGYLTLTQLVVTILLKYYSYQSKGSSCKMTSSKATIPKTQIRNKEYSSAIKSSKSGDCINDTTMSSIEEEPQEEEEEEVPFRLKCSLCLCKRMDSTATPCGHLFCWSCIHEWMESKTECPICRLKFAPSRLVHLQN